MHLVWIAKSRETAQPKSWCARSFGAGPIEGDKWISPPGSAFLPASQHTEFPHPPKSEFECIHYSVTDGVST